MKSLPYYNEKWGDNVRGKGLDNRFIVGNWKKRNEKWKHLSDQDGKMGKGVDVFETGGRSGRSMERENDPQQQKWGNSVREGVNKRFWIGSLRRMDTNDIEPSNATLPRRGEEQLLMHLFCRLKSSKYSNVTAGSNPYDISRHELQCHDILPLPPDSPEGCKVDYNYVKYVQLWKNPEGNFSCFCNISAKPKAVAANKVCCKYECCKDLANRCNNSSYPDRPDHTFCEAFKVIDIPHSTTAPNSGSAPTRRQQVTVQEPVTILTNSTTVSFNIPHSTTTTTTTEMVSIDIPHSTTDPNSGSAPMRKQQDLALVAAAIVIYIHRLGQANFF